METVSTAPYRHPSSVTASSFLSARWTVFVDLSDVVHKMARMSTSSARLPIHKILVECSCGKKYRVPAAKQGKKITCKKCGDKVRVPREAAVSDRSRGNILAELGIDPVAAQEAYKAEVARREAKKTYHCTRCEGAIGPDEIKGAYVKGELVCPGCRASDEVEDRKNERAKAAQKEAAKAIVTDYRSPEKARRAALGYGLLFFVGIAGPLLTLSSMRFGAIAIALVVALIGAATVYRHRA